MASTKRAAGRPRAGGPDRRRAIVEAARQQFRDQGYERATIRRIAEAADVHPALIGHYFDTKAELFAHAMELPTPVAEVTVALRTLPPDEWAPLIARTMLTSDPSVRETLVGVIRAASTDATAAETIRGFYEDRFLAILADLGIANAEMRSVMLSSVAVGLVMTGEIVGLDGFYSADPVAQHALVTSVVAAILTSRL